MTSRSPEQSCEMVGPRLGPAIERHIDAAFRCVMRGAHVVEQASFIRLLTGAPHPFANFSLISDASDSVSATAAIEPLSACGAPAAVLFPGEVLPPIDMLVRELGFATHDPMPAMAVDIKNMPPASQPAGYSIKRVQSGEAGDRWSAAFATGYELPPVVGESFSPNHVEAGLGQDEKVQFFAAFDDHDEFVATSMLFLHDGLAGIYAVATLPEHRNRGLGAFVTTEALKSAHRLGYGVGVLQSSPAGYPIYRRLGFNDYGAVSMYVKA